MSTTTESRLSLEEDRQPTDGVALVKQTVARGRTQPKPRILLAEDDPEMRLLLAEALGGDGYEVIEIEDGQQLIRAVEFHRSIIQRGRFFDVDLIISDIRMPGMSGLKALRELRQVDQATPVILITAFGDDLTHSEGYRLHAEAVIDKPFDVDAFRAYVRELLPPEAGIHGPDELW